MIKKMTFKERFLLIFFSVLILLISYCCPLYTQAAKIGGSDISTGSVKTTAVSVCITENTGIMGFKITVLYPSNILDVDSVERGTVTKIGSFASNYEKDGQIVVVWNNTEEISSDGSLFDIVLNVKDQTQSGIIRFSYSEEDTFNENYEAVKLELNPITITGKESDINSGTNTDSSNVSSDIPFPDTESADKSKDYYEIISKILKDYDTRALTENQKTEIVNKINSEFHNLGLEETFSDYNQVMLFYNLLEKNENKNQIKDNYSYEEIHKVTQDALDSVGVNSLVELDSSNKQAFAEEIKDALPKVEMDELESDEIVEVIEEILTEDADYENTDSQKEKPWVLYTVLSVVIIAVIAMLIYMIIFILRREKNANHKKSI